jgi:hypothetical protein
VKHNRGNGCTEAVDLKLQIGLPAPIPLEVTQRHWAGLGGCRCDGYRDAPCTSAECRGNATEGTGT